MTAARPTNRLAKERSPYLLQHAHNPVDWRPWGDEAFASAAAEDKPVFLSIGYSACHWCHVMERESFEDEAIAKLLNAKFVSIKVDREERPDVDQIYQLAHQVLTQRGGGWPLSMFLTQDKKPFFGGTYFPNERKYGMPSFQDVLLAIADAHTNKRADVDAQAAELTTVLRKVTSPPPGTAGAVEVRALEDATAQLMRRADRRHGGFGRAPKFPNTMTLDLLIIAAAVRGDDAARDHSCVTLDCMHRGGICDQIGGGFARYSTDEKWLIPHFEKMLYDNAQLAGAYLDGWRTLSDGRDGAITRERCRTVVSEVFAYVAREMTDASGVFYSAQDADSEGEEGKFFAWTPPEIEAVVGAADAPVVSAFYDVTAAGNFEHGKSVLWRPRPIDEVATEVGRSADEVQRIVAAARPKLFAAREKRPKPMRDDKCLVAWNGLMIGALADAGASMAEPSWIASAVKALGTWRSKAWLDGRLRHAIKDGEAYGTAFLDDHAGLALAAIHVYEAMFDPQWLAFARELTDTAIELFRDDVDGGFYYSPSDGEVVLHRTKEIHDHAYPGGVGMMADALLRLATLTGVLRYRTTADRLLSSVASPARENPMALGTLVRAIDRAARGTVEIVIAGDPDRADTRAMLHAARSVYTPHRTIVCVASEAEAARHGLDRALLDGRTALPDGGPRAYVCRGTVCDMPAATVDELTATLRRAVRAG